MRPCARAPSPCSLGVTARQFPPLQAEPPLLSLDFQELPWAVEVGPAGMGREVSDAAGERGALSGT